MSVIEASRSGKKQGNFGELNLEASLEPCRLLLLAGSLSTSKLAIHINLILVDEAPWTQRPWGKLPFLPLPLGGAGCNNKSLYVFLFLCLLHIYVFMRS